MTALRTVKGWAESFSTTPPPKEAIRYVCTTTSRFIETEFIVGS